MIAAVRGRTDTEKVTKISEQAAVTHWALDAETGVRYPLCSPECAKRFMVVTAVRCEGLEWKSEPFRPRHWCSHCSSCSRIITRPDPTDGCRQHTEALDCPDFRPLVTDAGNRAVRELVQRTGGPLPDRAFAYLEEACENQRDAGIWPDSERLVATVWDSRIDWAR